MLRPLSIALSALLCAGCTHLETRTKRAPPETAAAPNNAYASRYQAIAAPTVLITGATVLIGDGQRLDNADVLVEYGKISAVGPQVQAPAGATRVDGRGKWVTPGLIDVHSHLGVYPSPGMRAHRDGNEATAPVTAQVWAEHSAWPQDPGFAAALAGGVTTLQLLPGSANLVGGRGVTLKNVAATTVQEMKFPGAPHGLKMACGENPKRVYGQRGGPSTRMGNVAGYRAAFIDAADYARKRADDPKTKRDLRLETLAGALAGEILVHIHCYRADEMANMIELSKEFGFKITAFHHGVEAYKIAGLLAREGICGALWADWWGFKMEAWDGIQENLALVDRVPGGCAITHSDSAEGIQRLNQETAKVIANARRAGIEIVPERAIRWLTENAAKALGISDQTGTLEPGKMGDLVLWNRDPFSVYAQAEQVWIDGALVYQRGNPARQPVSDFVLGTGGGQ